MTKEEFEAMKEKAYALNRAHKERSEKCADVDVLIGDPVNLSPLTLFQFKPVKSPFLRSLKKLLN